MGFSCGISIKEKWKTKVCVNYKVLNKVTKKNQYPLPFCEKNLEKNSRAQYVHIWKWV
jgi:hypothetical protein